MATTDRPADFPKLPAFMDDKYYNVQLWRVAEVAGRKFSPSAKQVMTGEIAKTIADKIYTATPVEPPAV